VKEQAREIEAIRASLKAGDGEQLRDVVAGHASFAFRNEESEGIFNQAGVFEEFLQLLNEPLLIESALSSRVMILVETEWGTFSQAQQRYLAETLVRTVSLLRDELAQAIVFEVLGEFIGCAEGLAALEEVASSSLASTREWVPHALGHVSQRSQDSVIHHRVKLLLERLSADPSEAVQVQAMAALEHLHKHE
jgi:hypothetical protein